MNKKRAITIGVLLWIAALVIGVLLMLFFQTTDPSSATFAIAGLILLIILAAIGAKYYFKGKKVKKTTKEGFFVGLTFFIVGSVLDFVVLILPSWYMGNLGEVLAYYNSALFFVGVICILGVPALVGYSLSR